MTRFINYFSKSNSMLLSSLIISEKYLQRSQHEENYPNYVNLLMQVNQTNKRVTSPNCNSILTQTDTG